MCSHPGCYSPTRAESVKRFTSSTFRSTFQSSPQGSLEAEGGFLASSAPLGCGQNRGRTLARHSVQVSDDSTCNPRMVQSRKSVSDWVLDMPRGWL